MADQDFTKTIDDLARQPARFNFIDLFSGVGGLTLGFSDRSNEPRCRFVPRLLVDIDPEAHETTKRNFPRIPFLVADVHMLSGPEIRERAGLGPKDVIHVVAGGPPCQGWSWLGKRALDDERNQSIHDFLRVVRELHPLMAIMENVPLLLTAQGGRFIQEVCDQFGAIGYTSIADVVVASDYGVPQLRKRAFVLAYAAELGVPPQFPKRTHERVAFASQLRNGDGKVRFDPSKLPYISVEDAIGDLPVIAAGGGEEVMPYSSPTVTDYQTWARRGSIAAFNHRSRTHTADFLKKISVISEGSRNTELPDSQRFSDNYYSQAYARLHRNGIGQTITTSFGNPGSGRFTHYRELRSITVREAARFQSFPDAFVFEGNQATQMRHVGNAVPPLLARALRDQMARDLLAAGADRTESSTRSKPARAPEDPKERSRVMGAVPSKNTSAELILRRALGKAGVKGYRLHSASVPGKPDVLFPTRRVAVFVDGCFWHGCPTCYREPKSHKEYWQMKVRRNRERDEQVNAKCAEAGWKVVRVWEHAVLKAPERTVAVVQRALSTRPAA